MLYWRFFLYGEKYPALPDTPPVAGCLRQYFHFRLIAATYTYPCSITAAICIPAMGTAAFPDRFFSHSK